MNIKLVLISILISSVIWTLGQIVGESTKEKTPISISYINPPKGLILLNSPDTSVSIDITAQGLRLLTKGKNNVTLDLSKLKPHLNGRFYLANIPTLYFKKDLLNQLGVKEIGQEMFPDSLHFIFDDYIELKVPVKANVDLQFKESYSQNGVIKVSPDSVWVKGPASEVSEIEFVETIEQQFNNLDAPLNVLLACQSPSSNVSLSHQEVNIHLDVDQFTENRFMIPVNMKYNVSGVSIKTYPSEVEVSYQVALSEFDMVQDTSFYLEVIVDSMALLRKDPLLPQLIRFPSFVRNVRLNHESLDYVIIAK